MKFLYPFIIMCILVEVCLSHGETKANQQDLEASNLKQRFYLYNSTKGGDNSILRRVSRDDDAGDEMVLNNEFPWLGHLYQSNSKFVCCQASVINDWWVVTGAFCCVWCGVSDDLNVVLGGNPLSSDQDEEEEMIMVKIEKAVKHPYYFESPFENDIALFKLKESLYYKNISAINLPPSTAIFTGQDNNCLSMAWAQLRYLMKFKMSIFTDEYCKLILPHENVYDTTICAWSRNIRNYLIYAKGSPLVCKCPDGKPCLAGLFNLRVSRRPTMPELFTEVSHYIEWIEEVMKEENFEH